MSVPWPGSIGTVNPNDPLSGPFDVVVVGAGGSGAPFAARLSEDPDRRVLLLEAGDDYRAAADFPPEILDGVTLGAIDPGHPANWDFEVQLTADRTVRVPRGRIVGGSTSVNGTYFMRALPSDFDRWAAQGNTEWSYEKVLPFYRRLEDDRDHGASEVHGAGGPVGVRRDAPLHPITEAFFDACAELGFPEEMDKNAGAPPGYGLLVVNNIDGVRQNTALAYLTPIRDHRANLTIVGGAFVRRVVFEGTTAVGVEVDIAGERRVIHAGEVVLSAGGVKSPHLLLLSGVGPAAELERVGIPLVADLPGVGRDFSDHPGVGVVFRRTAAGDSDAGELWMQGVLSFTSSGSDLPGDLEIICRTKPFMMTEDDLIVLSTVLQQERSRGRLTLADADPETPPVLEYRYLSDPADLRCLREAVRVAAGLLGTESFRPYVAELVQPAADVLADDAALDRWLLDRVGTNIHLSASCRMGPDDDPRAVVDQYGRVRGVSGLRVADTSILPEAPSRGPAATAVMIGERMADLMRDTDSRGARG